MAGNVNEDANVRAKLAAAIVLLGIVGIFTVSGLAIWLVGDATREEMIRLVFASILPLLGTWVGSVIAYYFARESLQAATDSTERLIGRRDLKAPAQQVMIPKAQILAKSLPPGGDPKTVVLTELVDLMEKRKVHRIPIFDALGAVLLVVHDSAINAYVAELMRAGAPTPAGAAPPAPGGGAASVNPLIGKTIGDLITVPDNEKLLNAIAIVGPTATVGDARTAMRAVAGCNDVFLTTRGQRTDPVEGWLTNTDLAGWA